MKTKYFLLTMLLVSISAISFARSSSDTIKVWGNCDICKGKIEKAAKAAGAESADWNPETKMLTVSYDESKTSRLDIEKKIASVGYDTQDIKASNGAYNKLDRCCQYKRDTTSKGMDDMKDMKDMKGSNGMNNMGGMKCGMKDMNSSNAACCKDVAACGNSKDCTPDMQCCKDKEKGCTSCKDTGCCKTALGKGYNNIGSSCVIASANITANKKAESAMSCCEM